MHRDAIIIDWRKSTCSERVVSTENENVCRFFRFFSIHVQMFIFSEKEKENGVFDAFISKFYLSIQNSINCICCVIQYNFHIFQFRKKIYMLFNKYQRKTSCFYVFFYHFMFFSFQGHSALIATWM